MKGGKRLIAQASHPMFGQILQRIREGKYTNIERLFEIKKAFEKIFNITIENGNLSYRGTVLNNSVSEKILGFVRDGLPYRPWVKFLNKLMENPSQASRDSLLSYLEGEKLPVCDDGDFLAVKAIKSDWTDKHSGTVKNVLGVPVTMDRAKVNADSGECAGAGLHVGSATYVHGYGSSGDIYLLCKINPRDVVVVPNAERFSKIRVCRYVPVQRIDREQLTFNSDYAPKNTNVVPTNIKGKPARDSKGRFVKA